MQILVAGIGSAQVSRIVVPIFAIAFATLMAYAVYLQAKIGASRSCCAWIWPTARCRRLRIPGVLGFIPALSTEDSPSGCRNDASWLGAGESGDDELEEAEVLTDADRWGGFGPRPDDRRVRGVVGVDFRITPANGARSLDKKPLH